MKQPKIMFELVHMRVAFMAAAIALAMAPGAALAQGLVSNTISEAASAVALIVIPMVLASVLTWAAATSERYAGPARAKSPAERTLAEKAIIEADKRIDALNIGQLETFITRFVLSRIDKVLTGPLLDPMRQADELLVEGIDAFRRRNPELAAQMKIDPTSMRELIAAGIGQIRKDAMAAALSQPAAAAASEPERAAPSTQTAVIVAPVVVDGAEPQLPANPEEPA